MTKASPAPESLEPGPCLVLHASPARYWYRCMARGRPDDRRREPGLEEWDAPLGALVPGAKLRADALSGRGNNSRKIRNAAGLVSRSAFKILCHKGHRDHREAPGRNCSTLCPLGRSV